MAGFDRDSARRIRQAVRRSEATPRSRAGQARGPRLLPQGARYAVVTQAVQVRSGSTLGSGKARLQKVSVSSSNVATYSDDAGDPVWVFSGATQSDASIPVGRLVIVALVGGVWSIVVDFCTT